MQVDHLECSIRADRISLSDELSIRKRYVDGANNRQSVTIESSRRCVRHSHMFTVYALMMFRSVRPN